MSGSVNKVILIGNVGKDPEIRTMQSTDKVASFSIATSESWKDKASGERKEKTEWHRIAVWNQGLVGIVEKYVKKGSKIYIEGQLETRKWTNKDGVEQYSTEIVLKQFRGELTLLDSKADNQETARVEKSAPKTSSAPESFEEDSIPFSPIRILV